MSRTGVPRMWARLLNKYLNMYVCMYVCIYIMYVYIYIYAHTRDCVTVLQMFGVLKVTPKLT